MSNLDESASAGGEGKSKSHCVGCRIDLSFSFFNAGQFAARKDWRVAGGCMALSKTPLSIGAPPSTSKRLTRAKFVASLVGVSAMFHEQPVLINNMYTSFILKPV